MGKILAPILARASGNGGAGGVASSPQPEDTLVFWYLGILVVSGGFGGFVGSLDPDNNFRLRPWGRPKAGEPVELGWLGGVLIGIAAALGIMLIGDTFGVLQGKGIEAFQLLRLAALGVIAGYAGHSLLAGLRERVKNLTKSQVGEQVKEQTEGLKAEVKEDAAKEAAKESEKILAMNEALGEADRLLRGGDYTRARIAYEEVRDSFPPQRLRAGKGIANCLAYLGRGMQDDNALADADRLLKKLEAEFRDDASIAYNRMWVSVLIHQRDCQQGRKPTYSVEELCEALRRAIELDPESRRWARYERDLRDLLRREKRFADLVGGPPEGDGQRKWRAGQVTYHNPDCPLAREGEDWNEGTEPPPHYGPCTTCLQT